MKKLLIAALLVFGMSWPQARAQQELKEPPGKWWKNRQVINQLNLTTDQQSQIEYLWTQNRRILIDKKAELDKRNLDLSEILSQAVAEETAALKAYEQVQAAKAEVEREVFLMRIRIKNLLSLQQQSRLEEVANRLRGGAQANRVQPLRQPPANPANPRQAPAR
jgi:Spy/CpxP family protein refolding chaperone